MVFRDISISRDTSCPVIATHQHLKSKLKAECEAECTTVQNLNRHLSVYASPKSKSPDPLQCPALPSPAAAPTTPHLTPPTPM